jgi:hypothetical protein
LPVGQQDFAFMRVDTAVSQGECERISEKTDGVLVGGGAALLLRENIRLFANWKIGLDGVDL